MTKCPMCVGYVGTGRRCPLCYSDGKVTEEVSAAWRLGGLRAAMEIDVAVVNRIEADFHRTMKKETGRTEGDNMLWSLARSAFLTELKEEFAEMRIRRGLDKINRELFVGLFK